MRVLILTADIGAGHDLPAQLLADALEERGAEVTVVDAIEAAGGVLKASTRTGAETVLRRLPWVFAIQYFFLAIFAPTRAVISFAGTRLGRPVMQRLVAEHRPDVIASTYPGATEILGWMRTSGHLDVPVVAEITDLAALHFWANAGIDAHAMIHAESYAEVAQIAGTGHPIVHARGMVRPAFEDPPSRAAARQALELDPDARIVLVSGGGWGVGRLEDAADAALRAGATVICLCGSNDGLRTRLQGRGDPRLHAIGFTDRMPEWMAAADVLDPLDRRPDDARGAAVRHTRGLLRLGPRPHPDQQPRLRALRARARRRHVRTAGAVAAAAPARGAAAARAALRGAALGRRRRCWRPAARRRRAPAATRRRSTPRRPAS